MKRLALTLVLMSTLAWTNLSALARTTLTSPSLGYFFTLPPDYPTEVSSYDTPGSCDWYIETTNGDYVARSPRLTPSILAGLNSTFEAYYERLYYGSQGSDNAWDSAVYGPTSRRNFYWNIVPLFGPWTIKRQANRSGSRWEDVTSIVQQPEYLTPGYDTGRWKAYATDEDMSKPHAYIMGLGYDISKYATALSYSSCWTNSYSEFMSEASYTATRALTNSVPDYAALRNFSYQPTTHEVSRRLLDFDNYTSLWQNLQNWADEYINQYDDTKSFIYRPHWLNTGGDHAYWSSTALMGAFFDFPAFGWTQNPVESFEHPTYTAPVFPNFEYDGYCKHTGPAGISIPRSVFYNIYVDNSVWSCEDFGSSASCGYIPDILDGLFPELDHYPMPPLTRRLSFNDLCFINHYLSLFDRTYDIPQFNGFKRYLSTSRHHEKTEVAEVYATATRQADGTWIANISPTSLSWDAGDERTYDVPSTNSYGQARMATRVDSSTTGGSVSIEAHGNAGHMYIHDSNLMGELNAPYDATLCSLTGCSLGDDGVYVYATFYKGNMEVLESRARYLGDASAWNRATLTGVGTTLIDRSFFKQWTPLALDDEFNYSLSPHAPGPEAYQTERIADATTWFVEGHHKYVYTNQTFQSISNPLVYRGSDSSLRYRSVAADVTSRDVNHALNDELGSLAETLAEEDPDLSIADSWFDEVRDNRYSYGETCGAGAQFPGNVDELWLTLSNRSPQLAYWCDDAGQKHYLHPTEPIISISVHYSYSAGGSPYPGSVVESTPKNADIYIQPLTRVDWDWKALKRSSTSN